MTAQRYELELAGCSPIPLAHYLKALGILRIVSEQLDDSAQAWWEGESLRLKSTANREELQRFFLESYRPTPIVAPWNGGSGFYPKDNSDAVEAIENGQAPRYAAFRQVLSLCKQLIKDLGLLEKPVDDDKPRLLLECRNQFPDDSLAWLDAAFLLTADGPKYPPLLGTGGNDGRLEFTNNYMQRLCELIEPVDGTPTSIAAPQLAEAVFGDATCARIRSPIGQFDPSSTGGPNAGVGYDGSPSINAWDYIFMLEGALGFAAASARKLERSEPGVLAYPFSVRSTSVGYASAANSDEAASRDEIWLPIWDRPTTLSELKVLLAEGRVELQQRRARNGVDFARAIAALGIDRGITSFERYGFQQRNGLSYFAVPLGRFHVRANPDSEELLSGIDRWLDRFRRAATSKNAPSRVGRALRRLDSTIMDLCQDPKRNRIQAVLIALGEAEAAIVASARWRQGVYLQPIPLLSPQWLTEADDGLPEFRLAASLASIDDKDVGAFRRHLEPVEVRRKGEKAWSAWSEHDDDPARVWGGCDLTRNLLAVLTRRTTDALSQGNDSRFPGRGTVHASLGDVVAFIDSGVDDHRIEALLKGLILVDWDRVRRERTMNTLNRGEVEPIPDATYSLLKLCHLSEPIDGSSVPLTPAITRRACAGDMATASRLAVRRLRASNLVPAVDAVDCRSDIARRIAAAVLFPIFSQDVAILANAVLRPRPQSVRESVDPEVQLA